MLSSLPCSAIPESRYVLLFFFIRVLAVLSSALLQIFWEATIGEELDWQSTLVVKFYPYGNFPALQAKLPARPSVGGQFIVLADEIQLGRNKYLLRQHPFI